MHVSFSMTYVFSGIFFKEDSYFSIDKSHSKYIVLQHGNILKIMFCWSKKHFKRLGKQYL